MNAIKKTLLEVVIVAAIGVLLILAASYFIDTEDFENVIDEEKGKEVKYAKVRINESYLTLEIADDLETRALGLMDREGLAQEEGMLFVYDDEKIRYFWMKDVLFPLDMIFINETLEIVGFLENVPVCEQEPCPQYSIEEESKYVIEVNAGWVTENFVEIGQRVDFIVEDRFVP
jgi:uncharacterized membrane protein (UPF0127 family)